MEGMTEETQVQQEEQFLEEVLQPKDDLRLEPGELARYDPLKRYLLEISRFAPLTREEEHRLAVLYHETGDREAAYRLVTSNLKLVVKMAMIYNKVYNNLMDLIQEGNIGLIQAVKRFDPFRGTRLPTYAAWWIKAYIVKFLLDNSRMVKIGTTNARRKILMNLSREKRALEAKGISPTAQLLAQNLGVDEKEIMIDTLKLVEQSVDEKISQGEFQHLIEQKFQEFSETLSPRDQDILKNRLIAENPQTLQQIAERYSITREAVRVAEKKLIAKLKKYMVDSFAGVREIEFHLGS